MTLAKTEVLVLYDNRAVRDDLLPSHGFSCLVKSERGGVVLFDTGESGPLLLMNMERLGVEPRTIQKLVLSHEHYDHTGGLLALLSVLSDTEIFIPSSFSSDFEKKLSAWKDRIRRVEEAEELTPGFFSTGEMKGVVYEQGLVVQGEAGALLIGGCCHPGVVKMVVRASQVVGQPVIGVLGGLHLYQSEDRVIASTLKELQNLGVNIVAPCHCTGFAGIDMARSLWGSGFVETGVGTRFEWRGRKKKLTLSLGRCPLGVWARAWASIISRSSTVPTVVFTAS